MNQKLERRAESLPTVTSREIFAGARNTSLINAACTPDTYGYPCCPSCTTDVNWIRTNPCSGSSIPFTYKWVSLYEW